eukprot:3263895-Alexandrium_andersonii.AAC.1
MGRTRGPLNETTFAGKPEGDRAPPADGAPSPTGMTGCLTAAGMNGRRQSVAEAASSGGSCGRPSTSIGPPPRRQTRDRTHSGEWWSLERMSPREGRRLLPGVAVRVRPGGVAAEGAPPPSLLKSPHSRCDWGRGK